ncbi:MAG: hypothetical protein ACI959_001790 [Limisphaerales bacterium]|jgi:hypothetical protein
MKHILSGILLAFLTCPFLASGAELTGELKQWHGVTLTFDGPSLCEDGSVNPFMDYRLTVTFTDGVKSFIVPGYFAADGNAAETGATCGIKWRAHFTPSHTGTWFWSASFETGTRISISDGTGTPTAFDGAIGDFYISDTDKAGVDFRYTGPIIYKNRRYLRYAGSKEYFLMSGAGSPENFLAYADFDNTVNNGGINYIKTYSSHIPDWTSADLTWQGTKGKGILGAVNYLSSKGVNSQYMLTFNVDGDGDDVWPWVDPDGYEVFDVSKLAQWNLLFDHMDSKGIVKHFVLQEQENDQHLDGGNLGIHRMLYIRELVARFGHHPGLIWNIGEEVTQADWQIKQMASYIRSTDAYNHVIQAHTATFGKEDVYAPLLGFADFEGASLQVASAGWVDDDTEEWVTRSESNGRPWVVFMSEIGPAFAGVVPDDVDPDHEEIRRDFLWRHLLTGGSGPEWYFGYSYANNDLDCEDFRTRENMWEQTKIALDLFKQFPFHRMESRTDLVSRWGTFCLAIPGNAYFVQLPVTGTDTDLYLEESGHYYLGWYDPRNGGDLVNVTEFDMWSAGDYTINGAPDSRDWIAVVKRRGVAGGSSRLAGLNEPAFTKSNVFPNPASNGITIEFGAWFSGEQRTVVLFDMNGREVLRGNPTYAERAYMDLYELPEGIYMYRVLVNDEMREQGRISLIRP